MLELTYKRKRSVFHDTSPFLKITWLSSILFISIIFEHPIILLVLFLSSLFMAAISKIFLEWSRVMKLVVYFIPFVIMFNLVVNANGETVLWQLPFRIPIFGILNITLEELAFSLTMCIRIAAILGAFAVLNLTTDPDDLLRAVTKLRLPYRSVVVTSLSTKFVPVLFSDLKNVQEAQRSRGVDFSKGTLKQRIKKYGAVFFPLLSKSLDRSVQIAESMESRGFGKYEKRSFYNDTKLLPSEILLILVSIAPLVISLYMVSQGIGVFKFYQTIDPLIKSNSEAYYIITILLAQIFLLPLLKIKGLMAYD
ncbi:MAG: Energy-coupling factor transporter transmembrane protein EcfT [Candidatus Methanofastidiosum methylothiophilum]|uniref:Energy-coupling factor transporter transmembrane protein EcfT n=1 Tax=Candidatus Methanofastidiosum methylothiophilum TaxID=1705564 RepID=A0A150J175_9EURY|nr:MAG: Energy-coupling factor transporter transmembrane protein EcfT [Candidatus Methanofastidiosum methylthiophilus]KYC48332.1 MAG: Energy-coupling factor transporter transmembrane protein EcfT [Candidatus Methanofastidiosum methylthiophilus]KYC51001.1 MAG: Energy-coupling factor transporter transmembrane protein EcfT [Candidatus Methanofastidiosum methylthiophilus]